MKDGWPETIDELKSSCVTMREALAKQFGAIRENAEGYLFVACCGSEANMSYGYGIGPDRAHCKVCGREVYDVLSPFVSPFLRLTSGCVVVPNAATYESFGHTTWFVPPPTSNDFSFRKLIADSKNYKPASEEAIRIQFPTTGIGADGNEESSKIETEMKPPTKES